MFNVIAFQSTCPRGARRHRACQIPCGHLFQSTCPRGARRYSEFQGWLGTIFQSTCPRGARLVGCLVRWRIHNFNPRAHEGHDLHVFPSLRLENDFNPRAHEGHDIHLNSPDQPGRFQSTCPRGARPEVQAACDGYEISIHVPTRGTTQSGSSGLVAVYFNPRAHEGHDLVTGSDSVSRKFQSTCPRGARPPISGSIALTFGFQSTCPRGARPARLDRATPDSAYFNPRAHEGHDFTATGVICWPKISIHVPTRGTTRHGLIVVVILNFNPRAHEGHDVDYQRSACYIRYFNPRAHEGHDGTLRAGRKRKKISIHVPTRGTTSSVFVNPMEMTNFNPRAHEGHD